MAGAETRLPVDDQDRQVSISIGRGSNFVGFRFHEKSDISFEMSSFRVFASFR